MNARSRACSGFTLLELLIAIALFALLGLGTYRMLEAVLQSDEAVRAQELQLRELSRAVWAFERDLQQVIGRPIRDGFGDERNAFIGQLGGEDGAPVLELTRAGWRNPTGLRRANLQRVRWRLAGQNLERVYWVVLDRDVDSEPRVQRVLENVQGLQLRYLDEEAVWHEEWPPFDFGRGSPEDAAERLPVGLELSLEHARYGRITRVLRLPDAAAQAAEQALPGAEGVPEPFEGEMPQ
ncbi:type II secretion system minor pseudopilin GspJ [Stutzerimonas stutzeri]|uniref:Type II secretion system protein J n=1 Tax=Stutzerimonas stutzeri TaxID=316 RepID=A0A2N8RFP9_STUST|nr:type II secretion system minor pseudopilin GspJ [Stutzerimonas stutzeri]MCQ4253888.1 type II secretion system minor pseudopilin GspJ [Stutzerimonas stutzeri]PNF59908.1 type II secretion system protein GspJ [Stutzerimonas stutzeri]